MDIFLIHTLSFNKIANRTEVIKILKIFIAFIDEILFCQTIISIFQIRDLKI